ncbi:hypothetical protein HY643_02880 [Candidatus Woesearchaeota archaeon]|nr:hypothetical protein [Candidatus Woesearchaeota archaeon]
MFNKEDLALISIMRDDSRRSLPEISRTLQLPLQQVFRRFKYFKKTVIQKFVCLVDFEKIGYPHKVEAFVKCRDKEGLKNFLISSTNVNSAFCVLEDYDFLIEAVFKDFGELEEFFYKIEMFGIDGKLVHHLVEELKREDFLSAKNG